MGKKPLKGFEGHLEVIVWLQLLWWQVCSPGDRSWKQDRRVGSGCHCLSEALHPDLQLGSFQGPIKGHFASSIVLAESVACGLRPLKAGKCSKKVPGPLPPTWKGQQSACQCVRTMHGSPAVLMERVGIHKTLPFLILMFFLIQKTNTHMISGFFTVPLPWL